ncbi:MAG: VTT domain-containing protein [Clostridia bacterium]|nr:VTT domain-containing protein [Clostridia bacterium]MDD4386709.1 VTT domain-containing protein [Clostridia bacterium]
MLIVDFILNCDSYIQTLISSYGQLVYVVIFIVIFCETGLVFLPFLPGDSLIFAAGAFAGVDKMNIFVLYVILIIAAVLGDTVNYEIGKHFGRRILEYKKIKLVKDEHIKKADEFISKHGSKAVFLARFIPIVRTIVPFIVGMGKLEYKKFLKVNAIGGVLWVTIFLGLGYFFGNLEIVKDKFSFIILAIIFISLTPILVSFIKAKFFKNNNKQSETIT